MPKRSSAHYSVYVIELDRNVLNEKKFAQANPNFREDKPCVYVGMTGIRPIVRFMQHKIGYRSNRFVKKYGLRLKPRHMKRNPMTYEEAVAWEVEKARRLRNRGYAVWQN